MYKVGKLLPVVLVFSVYSSTQAAAQSSEKLLVNVMRELKDLTEKYEKETLKLGSGIVPEVLPVEAPSPGVQSKGMLEKVQEAFIKPKMEKNVVCYYSVQAVKLAAALAAFYGCYELIHYLYNKYYNVNEEVVIIIDPYDELHS